MATGSNIPNRQGPLPGRQTEVANAGDGFPAERDLKRARQMGQDARARLQEGSVEARGLHDDGTAAGPRGDDQESRGRGSDRD